MMHNRGNLPSIDEGEAGINEIDQMGTNDFVSHYRIGKKLVAGLSVAMVAALGLSIYSAVGAKPVADIQKNEKNLEMQDLDILSECLPQCYFEDIYSMNSVVVPLVAAKEILSPYVSMGVGERKTFLWEGMEVHKKVSKLMESKKGDLRDQLSDDSVYRQNIIFMVSHFLNRAEENALERRKEVGELCKGAVGKGTCSSNAKPVKRSLDRVVELVKTSNKSILRLVRNEG